MEYTRRRDLAAHRINRRRSCPSLISVLIAELELFQVMILIQAVYGCEQAENSLSSMTRTKERKKEKYSVQETTCRTKYGGDVQLLSSHTALKVLGPASAGSRKLKRQVIWHIRMRNVAFLAMAVDDWQHER